MWKNFILVKNITTVCERSSHSLIPSKSSLIEGGSLILELLDKLWNLLFVALRYNLLLTSTTFYELLLPSKTFFELLYQLGEEAFLYISYLEGTFGISSPGKLKVWTWLDLDWTWLDPDLNWSWLDLTLAILTYNQSIHMTAMECYTF